MLPLLVLNVQTHIVVRLPDVLKHVFEGPDRNVAVQAAPVAGSQVLGWGHLGVVGAAHRSSALTVGPHGVAQVQVDVRDVKNLARWRASLNLKKDCQQVPGIDPVPSRILNNLKSLCA